MLQIEHIYYFLFDRLFFDLMCIHLPGGVPTVGKKIEWPDMNSYERDPDVNKLIFFYDQEPIYKDFITPYTDFLDSMPLNEGRPYRWFAVSEKSELVNELFPTHLYYFFHGFAALDWFRSYYAINYSKPVIKKYSKDFISFNRIITGDRAYRKDFIDQLRKNDLLDKGLISYGVTDEPVTEDRLVIDHAQLPGSASASIPIDMNRIDKIGNAPDYSAFWHIVTETVFYYDKLHLTEKIFKPIVSKQPFMLLAAPGNLEYLKSYGFKTFEGIIDESYDKIEDNDKRIEAVVDQIKWWCDLPDREKFAKMCVIESIVEYNFHHFYGKFKEIITDELLDNTKKLFKEIDYDDRKVDYATVRKLLTS